MKDPDLERVTPTSTEELCESERRLLTVCQEIRFGSLIGLPICDGKPLFDPPPKMRYSMRLNENSISSKPKPTCFALKDKHRLLLHVIREMKHGVIARIDIRNGLPEEVCIESDVV